MLQYLTQSNGLWYLGYALIVIVTIGLMQKEPKPKLHGFPVDPAFLKHYRKFQSGYQFQEIEQRPSGMLLVQITTPSGHDGGTIECSPSVFG